MSNPSKKARFLDEGEPKDTSCTNTENNENNAIKVNIPHGGASIASNPHGGASIASIASNPHGGASIAITASIENIASIAGIISIPRNGANSANGENRAQKILKRKREISKTFNAQHLVCLPYFVCSFFLCVVF
jgi:hypothetical protein